MQSRKRNKQILIKLKGPAGRISYLRKIIQGKYMLARVMMPILLMDSEHPSCMQLYALITRYMYIAFCCNL